jgi:spore germination cell wall hydrolase CwlJ-like protein
MGSGIGLALGAGYMTAGMAQAVSDHHRAVRIAGAAGGGLSETMLQREINRMDPAAARLAKAHDLYAAGLQSETANSNDKGAFPGRPDLRQPGGRHGSPLEGARSLDCLTEAVYFEARGETPRGQAAVAQVVMNRVANPNFPKTVCGVVFQGAAQSASGHGCQFSFACDGAMHHGLESEAWDRARRIAERALSGVVLADVGAATHFHTLDVRPGWGPQMLRVAQVGLHVFYRPNPHAPAMMPASDSAPRVLASLPLGPTSNLRMAGAVIEKATEASVQAVAAPDPRPVTAASADRAGEPASDRAPAGGDR